MCVSRVDGLGWGQQGRCEPVSRSGVQWGLLDTLLPLPRGAGLSSGACRSSEVTFISRITHCPQYFLCSQSLAGCSSSDNSPAGILTSLPRFCSAREAMQEELPPPPAEPGQEQQAPTVRGGGGGGQTEPGCTTSCHPACCAGPAQPVLQSCHWGSCLEPCREAGSRVRPGGSRSLLGQPPVY